MEQRNYSCSSLGSGFSIDRRLVDREAKLKAEVQELIDIVVDVVEEIRISGGTPYLKALQHCLVHVANGGTLATFKPLVRTPDYAGLDRRQSSEKNQMH